MIKLLSKPITKTSLTTLSVTTLIAATPLVAEVGDFTDISNKVTATATGVGGNPEPAIDTVDVPVEDADAKLTIDKSASTTGSGAGGTHKTDDIVTYTFVVKNEGNTWLYDVGVEDTFADATGSLTDWNVSLTTAGPNATSSDNGTDAVYDKLEPGATATFTAKYTVQLGDMESNGDADGSGDANGQIDNTAKATATQKTYDNTGAATDVDIASATDDAAAVLDIKNSITIDKVAKIDGADVPATGAKVGDVITYTYTVTNDGTTPLQAVGLSDEHQSASGTITIGPGTTGFSAATLTDNGTTSDSIDTDTSDATYEYLAPEDVLTYTWTYTVTQDDIDQLQ